MIYAENVLIFLVAPMAIGFFLMKGETKQFIGFFILGAVICLLCTYVNGFVTAVTGNFVEESVIRLTPVVEEVMKTLPLLFYVSVFLPKNHDIWRSTIALGIGFATFENCCHVILSGADDFSYMLIRGFAAGIMHVICSMIFGWSLTIIHTRRYLVALGVVATVCMCITYHAIYNLLVSSDGIWQMIGYALPMVTVGLVFCIQKTVKKLTH